MPPDIVVEAAIELSAEHAIASGTLGIDHSDPFDRLLIATALIEGSS